MKKILLVDDERPVREILRSFLTKKGFEVLVCGDGEEALRLVAEQAPALVLLDIRLPQTDGLEVLKKIKEINKEVGIIVVTGVAEPAMADRCRELGAFDYLAKPVKLELLEETILMKFFESFK
jgi:DNA-binding response OmpR family regulator